MFEEFRGIPAHPLLIHAAVILVPLLALLAVAYALVPFVRPHIRWVLGLVALATPGAALLAKLSGDAFYLRLQNRNAVSEEYVPIIENHRSLGTLTLYWTIGLSVVTLALVYLVGPRVAAARAAAGADAPTGTVGRAGPPRAVTLALAVLAVATAAVSLYYVVRTGDAGAKAVWDGR